MVEHTGPPPRNKVQRGAVILPAGSGACSFPLEGFLGLWVLSTLPKGMVGEPSPWGLSFHRVSVNGGRDAAGL